MHTYDVTLKELLCDPASALWGELTVNRIVRWLGLEFPEARQLRVDLLAETAGRNLLHTELQSTPDPLIPNRMADYYLAIERKFGRYPDQVVFYVGSRPFKPSDEVGPSMRLRYRTVDIRDLNGELLLASPYVGDNVIAILTRAAESRAGLAAILDRVAKLEPRERADALHRLLILAGLRKRGLEVKKEIEHMPILDDFTKHEVFGKDYKRGIERGERIGRKRGKLEGIEVGKREEVERVIRGLVQERFGKLPKWASAALEEMTRPELETLSLRLLRVSSLNELLQA